ncbi:bifunctional aspartate kinase/homoserine dehydrogenase I [Polluticaenibacter yanchengensis]|uniref:Bifunctional aspartate kinase/homoserine dehydrogenase I n=1 Tax=Polluticaenibacter yanchengensis TaxID=3014562 RepID=A0ABT4UPG6_9BACT|nr:bifunctional aspartate kinase/homoserine dehydrogenase I [Chitinophagaceae bacterium LY-5]
MKVLKFGGTSVANAINIKKVASIVFKDQPEKLIVVVSAFSGVTDLLLKASSFASTGDYQYKEIHQGIEKAHLYCIKELVALQKQSAVLSEIKQLCNELEELLDGIYKLQELSPKTRDKVVSFGELMSSRIIAAYFSDLSAEAAWVDSRELIKTDSKFGYANVLKSFTDENIALYFKAAKARVFVAPGFIASNSNGNTTTLGRGGSDYTAAIFASALKVKSLEIWTDVSGMMTADPRVVTNAKPIAYLTYKEAMELSHFGAKVIYPPTIQPVMDLEIPTAIKNTFKPEDAGTLLLSDYSNGSDRIKGISSINKVAILTLEGSGMVGIPGFSKLLFEALANDHINVILITQSSSEHSITVAINEHDSLRAKVAIDSVFDNYIEKGIIYPVEIESDMAIIAVVGDKMKSMPGTSGLMFSTLGKNGINIRAIAQGSSERNISAVISNADIKKAVNVLHEVFFEASKKQLNIFVSGVGNVGKKLLQQISRQKQYLADKHNVQLNVIGVANSRKMLVKPIGILENDFEKELGEYGHTSDVEKFTDEIIALNLRNSVFIDCTAHAEVARTYAKLIKKSVSVVACNKIAASAGYWEYLELKHLSNIYNAPFLFETNVGAALPIIGTLNDLIKTGDVVNKIQAVLSGTLNFVFNNYDGTKPFSEVVRQAQAEGFTEPDPRLDLGGTDVMRKILILAREAGYALNMEDIDNNGFLPASCFDGSVEDFYKEMSIQEAHFKAIYDKAAANGCKLKFVATFDNGKANVGLQEIPENHDLYNLFGKDNIVLFYTNRYPEQPLVIKGAGAGADVTASGVFADMMRVASH